MKNDIKLLSIGEISKAIGVSRRMILYYEDRGLVSPDIKNGPTGNRYYTPDTLTRIRSIRVLNDIGLSLDEVKDYYSDRTDLRPILKRLETRRDELNLSIEKLRERLDGAGDCEEIVYTDIPAQTVFCKTLRSGDIDEKKNLLRVVMFEAMRRYGSDTSRRMCFLEHPLSDPEEVSYCIAVPEGSTGEEIRVLPEVQAVRITHHGDYEELPEVKQRLLAYIRTEGLRPLGVCRHIYLEGPPQHIAAPNFITQVVVPVADRRRG